MTVTEDDIIAAMRLCFERLKVAVEPSGAVGLAAVLTSQFRARFGRCARVGVVLCGGNVDLDAVGFFDGWRRASEAL